VKGKWRDDIKDVLTQLIRAVGDKLRAERAMEDAYRRLYELSKADMVQAVKKKPGRSGQ
jgi:hypothetical protein